MYTIPYQTIDWNNIEQAEHPGEQGTSYWRTVILEGLRLRIVTYSPGYIADHWCRKGHIVHCLEGAFTSELESGEQIHMTAGMMYIVSDEASSHRSISATGAKLLIVDGEFLKSPAR